MDYNSTGGVNIDPFMSFQSLSRIGGADGVNSRLVSNFQKKELVASL